MTSSASVRVWSQVFGPKLKIEDFAAVRINWEPTAVNMAALLETMNLTPRSVVFVVDDNPVERAAMKAAFPDIRVLDGDHYYWKRILLWSAETQVAGISAESSRRTEMIQAQTERETTRGQLSREDFLRSLDLTIGLFAIGGPG